MFLSMTGFGSKTAEISFNKEKKVTLTIEIKSINSRFFELISRLPNSLNYLETEISSLLKNKLLRGRVYLTISTGTNNNELDEVSPSLELAKSYLSAANTLKKKFKLQGDITISDIISLPNIFSTEKINIDSKTQKLILNNIEKVVEKLYTARENEGSHLKNDLIKRFDICKKTIEKIQKIYEKLMKDQKNLIAKTQTLAQEGNEEAKNQLEILYSTLNKIDINEEITRFKGHLVSTTNILKNKDIEKGKHLDFVLQELSREINTISAKCSNFELNSMAVDVKVELEKAREQVQNVL